MDGKMIAVDNMVAIIGKSTQAGGGLNGVVQWLPMEHVIQTLLGLYQAREQAKDILYEVSAESAILSGARSIPREKASQSKIKANFASQRLEQRRRAVERTARDVLTNPGGDHDGALLSHDDQRAVWIRFHERDGRRG